jgi:hypothetical protein
MTNSVCAHDFDPRTVAGVVRGAIDAFDYVDAHPGLVAHPRPARVPRGAPVAVAGWVRTPSPAGSVATGVIVVVDGSRAYDARVRGGRFDAVVLTAELTAGAHEVRAYALDGERAHEAAYHPFTVYELAPDALAPDPGAIRLGLEPVAALTAEGALLSTGTPVRGNDFVLLSGWALDGRAGRAPVGVTAVDAAGRRWSAPCDVARPDIRTAHGAEADRIGFEITIPAAALGRGRHALRVAAYGAAGVFASGATDVVVDVAGTVARFPSFARLRREPAAVTARVPRGAVERGELLVLDGWALDPDGGGAGEVFLELRKDGVSVPVHRLSATAGYRRDEPPTELPAPPVADGWFDCPLDTAVLRDRAYDLVAVVVAAGRTSCARRALGTLRIEPASAHAQGQPRAQRAAP